MFKYLLARAQEARAAELEGEGGLEGGFTLIELMVVLLIIAILLAIAIPTFLGVSGSARDRSAQSNLTTALTDTIAYYQNAQTYDASSGQATAEANTTCSQSGTCSAASPAVNTSTKSALKTQEPSYNWQTGACTPSITSCISVAPVDVNAVGDGQGVILGTYSPNKNTCWYVMNLQAGPGANSPGDTTATDAFDGVTGSSALPAAAPTTAGTFYAYHQGSTSCSASTAETYTWGSSYSSAGAN